MMLYIQAWLINEEDNPLLVFWFIVEGRHSYNNSVISGLLGYVDTKCLWSTINQLKCCISKHQCLTQWHIEEFNNDLKALVPKQSNQEKLEKWSINHLFQNTMGERNRGLFAIEPTSRKTPFVFTPRQWFQFKVITSVIAVGKTLTNVQKLIPFIRKKNNNLLSLHKNKSLKKQPW